MSRLFLVIALLAHFSVFAQTSDKYNSAYANFYRAEDLYNKEQYGAARKEFRIFIDEFKQFNDPLVIKARYYEAISALELYNNDALDLLEQFNRDYPESIYRTNIYFRLGKFYFYKKNYKESLAWFNRLSAFDVEEDERDEFYFKIGYANFHEKNFDAARDAFYEVKNSTSEYGKPSLYYYSHIAYQNENYEMALEGFLKLENDEKFGQHAAYYIAQIYYLQGDYEKVTEYASRLVADDKVVNEKDMNHLIGDAYYRVGKFDEAIPYLEKYDAATNTTRDEDYQLGYAYYKTGRCDKAIRMFDRVKRVEDSLAQVALYHIGECQLKNGNKLSARSAFEEAAFIDKDPVIQEDALYNYAILSYQLDINPYDEAVEAFELYLNRYPNSERKENVYQYLVNVYTSTNNYAKALASLDKLPNKDVKLKTAYQLIAYNQGVERFQNSDFPGAISSFKLVEKYQIDPKISAQAIYWSADANYRLSNYSDAINGYKTFISLPAPGIDGLKTQARYNIGYAYWNLKDYPKCIESFRSFADLPEAKGQKKADAYMRVADSYYTTKQNEPAVEFYKKALGMKAGYEDQALYYMAKTYSYMGGYAQERITNLLDIINNYRESKYLQSAIYEVALTYKSTSNWSQALKYFNQIIYDYPSSGLVIDARINVASVYESQGNSKKAEEEYLALLNQYGSDSKVCEAAANALIELYKKQSEPEKIEALAAKYSCVTIDPNDQENLYYPPALEAYNDSSRMESVRLQDALNKFDKYLVKFPNGRYVVDAKFYMADCHYRLGNEAQAIQLYREVLDLPVSQYTEKGAVRTSKYLYNEGQYEDALKYYALVEKISSSADNILNAQIGLMRSHYYVENWQNAALYAEKVLKNASLSAELKEEAYYVEGMAYYRAKEYNKAITALEWLSKNRTNSRGSEAQFVLADISYQKGDFGKADTQIDALLKRKPANNYWIAKGLILRTRVYMSQDRLLEAEQTLSSVREHYPVPDDGIMDEADELWAELMQLKNAPKNITPESNPIIEINGQ